jgi:hypothetical protein
VDTPRPTPRTNRTRRVPPPVLIGRRASGREREFFRGGASRWSSDALGCQPWRDSRVFWLRVSRGSADLLRYFALKVELALLRQCVHLRGNDNNNTAENLFYVRAPVGPGSAARASIACRAQRQGTLWMNTSKKIRRLTWQGVRCSLALRRPVAREHVLRARAKARPGTREPGRHTLSLRRAARLRGPSRPGRRGGHSSHIRTERAARHGRWLAALLRAPSAHSQRKTGVHACASMTKSTALAGANVACASFLKSSGPMEPAKSQTCPRQRVSALQSVACWLLCSVALCCAVLCCAVLCCAALCRAVLSFTPVYAVLR